MAEQRKVVLLDNGKPFLLGGHPVYLDQYDGIASDEVQAAVKAEFEDELKVNPDKYKIK